MGDQPGSAETVRGPERNQCLGCGGPIDWSRWFCNYCAAREGLTAANGLSPSRPGRKPPKRYSDGGGGHDD